MLFDILSQTFSDAFCDGMLCCEVRRPHFDNPLRRPTTAILSHRSHARFSLLPPGPIISRVIHSPLPLLRYRSETTAAMHGTLACLQRRAS